MGPEDPRHEQQHQHRRANPSVRSERHRLVDIALVRLPVALAVAPLYNELSRRTRVNLEVCALKAAGKVWSGGEESMVAGCGWPMECEERGIGGGCEAEVLEVIGVSKAAGSKTQLNYCV